MKTKRLLPLIPIAAFLLLAGCAAAPSVTLHFGGEREGLAVYADDELLGQTPLRVPADAVCGGRVPCELVLVPKTGEPVRLIMDRWDRIARPEVRRKTTPETGGFGGYFFIAISPAPAPRYLPIPAPLLVRTESGNSGLTDF